VKIIIVVRRTADYKSMTKDKFLKQKKWKDHTLQRMYEVISLWDETFKIKYFEFRYQLKSIAASNWISIPNLDNIVTNSKMLTRILSGLTDNYILLFVDDDDWFNPSISSILTKNERLNSFDAYNWPLQYFMTCRKNTVEKNTVEKKPLFYINDNNRFYTNNYAITKKGYKKLNKEEIDILTSKYWDHQRANTIFHDESRGFNINFLDEPYLSMTNKTLSSVGELWKYKNIKNKKDALIKRVFDSKDFGIPKIYKWATKYIRAVEQLYKDMI
jgi:hypothetical protein